MATDSTFLAFDFGAESGRALLGEIKDGKLTLRDIHRFPNVPVMVLGKFHWDVLRLFNEIRHGLRLAVQETGGKIDGIGIDTWGVDFALLGEDGEPIGMPFHYRDERTNGMMEKAFSIVPKAEIWDKTGIQFMQLNSLYQLVALAVSDSPALKNTEKLLMIPDLFNYWLTGVGVSEFSIASTSQVYNPVTGGWDEDLLKKIGVDPAIMPEIVQPGAKIGNLDSKLAAEMGLTNDIPVFAPCCHDTGSAVAAVPATTDKFVYISSGTWSLMGTEIDKPLLSREAMEAGFTNEGGVAGTFRFLHNIMGLWIVQECRRTWLARGEEMSYTEITSMAAESEGFRSIIDPDDVIFLTPGDMPARIQDYCAKSGQPVPETYGQIIRCALDGLALRYRDTLEKLEKLHQCEFEAFHIVGGGIQNKLLCQITADATGRKITTGPIEATAAGNILVQALGAGKVESLAEIRKIVRRSFDVEEFTPRASTTLEKAYAKFQDLQKG